LTDFYQPAPGFKPTGFALACFLPAAVGLPGTVARCPASALPPTAGSPFASARSGPGRCHKSRRPERRSYFTEAGGQRIPQPYMTTIFTPLVRRIGSPRDRGPLKTRPAEEFSRGRGSEPGSCGLSDFGRGPIRRAIADDNKDRACGGDGTDAMAHANTVSETGRERGSSRPISDGTAGATSGMYFDQGQQSWRLFRPRALPWSGSSVHETRSCSAPSLPDVATAKAMFRGCEAMLCLMTGALELRSPGCWGGRAADSRASRAA